MTENASLLGGLHALITKWRTQAARMHRDFDGVKDDPEQMTGHADGFEECADELAATLLAHPREGLPEDVDIDLRRHLWISHGHRGIYGDDGEMQCSQCAPVWDYRRAPLSDVIRHALKVTRELNMAALAAHGPQEAQEQKDQDDPRSRCGSAALKGQDLRDGTATSDVPTLLDGIHRARAVIEAVRAIGSGSWWDAPHWTLHVPARLANALFDLAYDTDKQLADLEAATERTRASIPAEILSSERSTPDRPREDWQLIGPAESIRAAAMWRHLPCGFVAQGFVDKPPTSCTECTPLAHGGTPQADLESLVMALQAHAKEQGWQDVDDPIADLLAWVPAAHGGTAPHPEIDSMDELLHALDELYPLTDDDRRVERAGWTAFIVKRFVARSLDELAADVLKRAMEAGKGAK